MIIFFVPHFSCYDYKHLNNNIMATIYDFKAVAGNGKEIDFRQFEGKVLLGSPIARNNNRSNSLETYFFLRKTNFAPY